MHFRESFSRRFFMVFNVVFLAALALACLLPMINVLAVSFSSAAAAQAGYVTFWPISFTLKSYEYALGRPQFLTAMGVSIERIALGGAINMVLTILAAYPLSRDNSKFRLRTAYSWFFVVTMLVSGGLIPTFMVISKLGMMDSLWALIIPGALPVFNLILLIGFFRQLPTEMEEAATIDGASHWRILWGIFVPCSAPAIATLTLFVLVGHWNSWFDGLLYMNRPEHYPLQSYLQTVIVQRDTTALSMEEYKEMALMSDRTIKASQVFMGAIPILLVYPFLQRYFVTGIVLGSVKG
jgi:putative aldouronate transport system permease protein